MQEHPINNLMEKAMENIKKMVEVNTIIGEAVETKNGTVIIPVTKVSCGFAAGGSQGEIFINKNAPAVPTEPKNDATTAPFGGGSGGGVTVQPVGFLIVHDNDIRFQVVDNTAILDRLLDQVPEFVKQIKSKVCTKEASSSDNGLIETTTTQTTVTVEPVK